MLVKHSGGSILALVEFVSALKALVSMEQLGDPPGGAPEGDRGSGWREGPGRPHG